MQKSLMVLFVVGILLVSSFGVIAEGVRDDRLRDSVRDAVDDSDGNLTRAELREKVIEQAREVKAELKERFSNKTCDDFNETKDRIKCRLVKAKLKEQVRGSVPESCRELEGSNKGRCVALYNAVQKCYEILGKDKDSCLRRAVGLREHFGNMTNATERKEKARNYAVGLFGDLEKRVEKAVENGDLSEEEGTDLIAQIDSIKEDILAGKTKAEIQEEVRAFKDAFVAARTAGEVD